MLHAWKSDFLNHSLIPSKRIYGIPSYLPVSKLQIYFPQCSGCVFFRKMEEKLFSIIEAINKASATNSIISLSRTLYDVAENTLLYSL